MDDELLPIEGEKEEESIIKVIGVGGGGGNAVNHMYNEGITGVDFVIANTDAQALLNSPVDIKIQLGGEFTEGLGAGNKPAQGKKLAEESINEINEILTPKTKMVFITAGMGGGTGTGAAPIVAKAAFEKGILTVGIVTIPFRWERQERIQQAIDGITELEQYVDALLVINNEKLREIYGNLKLSEAFAKADDILLIGAKGIAEAITRHGKVSVDFADVETVMKNSGVALMGTASAKGENRAINVIRKALDSPLLNSNDVQGAKNILLNIVSGESEVKIHEINEMLNYLTKMVGNSPDVIYGTYEDPKCGDELTVTIVATGFEENPIKEIHFRPKVKLSELEMKVENAEEQERKAKERRKRQAEERKKRQAEELKLLALQEKEEEKRKQEEAIKAREKKEEKKAIHKQRQLFSE